MHFTRKNFCTLIYGLECSHVIPALMIDESTDSSNTSKLLLLLRYCENLEVKEKYLGVCTLGETNAQTIFDKAWELLNDDGYLLEKLVVVFGDNAPCIQGEIGGVITKFKEKVPHIKEGRCFSHLYNLVVKNFIENTLSLRNLKVMIYKLTDYFRKSPKRSEYFRSA